MRRCFVALLFLGLPSLAMAQAPITFVGPAGEKVYVDALHPLPTSGSGSSGTGGGDASAANQQTQITAEQLIGTRIGDLTSPATGSTNYRLGQIVSALGAPLQAGGTISVSNFPATQPISGTVTANLGTLNGAATAANQASMLAAMPGVATAGSAAPTTGTLALGSQITTGTARALLTDNTGMLYVRGQGSGGEVSIVGSSPSGATDNGNPVKVGGYASSSSPTAVTAGQRVNAWYSLNGASATFLTDGSSNIFSGFPGNADGQSAAGTGLATWSRVGVYNGTSYDRQRDATSANATAGTGLLGAGVLGRYTATVPTYTDGQFGVAQMTNRGNLAVSFADQNGAVFTSGFGVGSDASGSARTYVNENRGYVYNGTAWDRARGDTTGGAWVQEKERSSYFAETTTALAASAPFTGTTRDAGVSPSQWASFTCMARADQSGNLTIRQSDDGTTWTYTVQGVTVPLNSTTTVTSPVFYRYSRCEYSNGSTAQTSFVIRSRFGAN